MQKQIFALFWRAAMRYPWRTTISIINPSLTGIIGAFIGPLIIAQLLEKLQAGNLTLDAAWPPIIMYAATQIYGEIIGWRITLYTAWSMEVFAERDLYNQIVSHLSQQSLGFHANRFGGSLVSQATKLTGSFERFWNTIIFEVVPVTTSVITATVVLGFIFWQYAVVLAVMSVVFALFVFVTSRFLARLTTKEAQASSAMSGRLADIITNVMTVKSHGAEEQELKAANKLADVWRARSLDEMRGFLKISTGYSSMIVIINLLAIITAVWASEHHLISIGTVYLAVTYTLTVARQLWEINGIMRGYNRVLGDAHDMAEILSLQPEIKDTHSAELSVKKGIITIDHIRFAHENSENNVLFDDFSLMIPAGQKVGLVGHSGSGKTTLTRLLLRFSDLDSGTITIDGQDIGKVTQASLRRAISYVPQEPLLFHRSLRENIAYGRPDATDEEIYHAAKQAHALEFIETLPQKFDTMVGERGVKLSGGQRQRIAIARAILKDAPILVLDEATSALDSESERLIQDALKQLMKGRTSLVIAHRLSTISKLDRIVVLENGRIIEDGSHQALLEQKGSYARLWSHQSGGFIEE